MSRKKSEAAKAVTIPKWKNEKGGKTSKVKASADVKKKNRSASVEWVSGGASRSSNLQSSVSRSDGLQSGGLRSGGSQSGGLAARRKEIIANLRKKWAEQEKKSRGWKYGLIALKCLLVGVWGVAALFASQYIVAGVMIALKSWFGVYIPDDNTRQFTAHLISSLLCLLVLIFVPWLLFGEKTTRDELGLRGLPTWSDIGLGVIGFILSMAAMVIVSGFATWLLQQWMPWVDMEQEQDLGYTAAADLWQLALIFISLVIVAPVMEEIVFRGYMYGKMRAKIWALPAIVLVSILFGVAHGQVNVAISVAVMSAFMCIIREMTGTVWGGMIVHMMKNGLAFYLIYISGVGGGSL